MPYIDYEDINSIRPSTRHPRQCTQRQTDSASLLISSAGIMLPIIVDGNDEIIIGEEWFHSYKSLRIKKIPVIKAFNLSPSQLSMLKIGFYKIIDLGHFDEKKLADEVKILCDTIFEFNLQIIGFDPAEEDSIISKCDLIEDMHIVDEGDDEAELLEIEEQISQLGDKWQLGDHILLHGETQRTIMMNEHKGCVLDLVTFWAAWKLQAVDTIVDAVGKIHVCQSLIDNLRLRKEWLKTSSSGLRKVHAVDGKIIGSEISGDEIAAWMSETEGALNWLHDNAVILPVIAAEDLPEALKKQLGAGDMGLFDSLIIAVQNDLLFVTDDLAIRAIDKMIRGPKSAWSHLIFWAAQKKGIIDFQRYLSLASSLIRMRQTYLGVTSEELIEALKIDEAQGGAPGEIFRAFATQIGGKIAEPVSHVDVCITCIAYLWTGPTKIKNYKAATGLLLERVISEREKDYKSILKTIAVTARSFGNFIEYFGAWFKGHFLQ